MGIPELNAVRGISTPHINQLSDEGMRMARMYTEPSCTPTRVAFSIGRLPVRMGMGDTTVDISGFGLPGSEVTLAELLKEAGYNTSHVGKWPMGDIAESWAMNQGFDFAAMPIHQQGQLTIFNDDAIREQVAVGLKDYQENYTLGQLFRPDASAMVFRGGKGDTTEGGIRVDAFIRWPGVIAEDTIANNIIHVSDLYTTLARFAGADGAIPRDRLVDGVDQSAALLIDDKKGRRDSVIVYSIASPKAIIKDQLKLELPPAGASPILASFYDVFRDTHEKYSVSTEVGAWGGQEIVRILGRHLMRKEMYPDTPPAMGVPYEGIENLRPETQAAVEAFMLKRSSVSR